MCPTLDDLTVSASLAVVLKVEEDGQCRFRQRFALLAFGRACRHQDGKNPEYHLARSTGGVLGPKKSLR